MRINVSEALERRLRTIVRAAHGLLADDPALL